MGRSSVSEDGWRWVAMMVKRFWLGQNACIWCGGVRGVSDWSLEGACVAGIAEVRQGH